MKALSSSDPPALGSSEFLSGLAPADVATEEETSSAAYKDSDRGSEGMTLPTRKRPRVEDSTAASGSVTSALGTRSFSKAPLSRLAALLGGATPSRPPVPAFSASSTRSRRRCYDLDVDGLARHSSIRGILPFLYLITFITFCLPFAVLTKMSKPL